MVVQLPTYGQVIRHLRLDLGLTQMMTTTTMMEAPLIEKEEATV